MNELNHLAIIMDGNGRWAKKQGFMRTKGHEAGASVVENVASYCLKKGISKLTLYAFSTENWKRPQKEVEFLMNLLSKFLVSKQEYFVKNGVKFHTIGDLSKLSDQLNKQISHLKTLTKDNSKLNLALAINYGSKDEILRALKALVSSHQDLNEMNLSSHLDTSEFGDVDLLVRTGGEHRLSNFLLWQAAYAELHFSPTLWPDFSLDELDEIARDYAQKHRKFGAL